MPAWGFEVDTWSLTLRRSRGCMQRTATTPAPSPAAAWSWERVSVDTASETGTDEGSSREETGRVRAGHGKSQSACYIIHLSRVPNTSWPSTFICRWSSLSLRPCASRRSLPPSPCASAPRRSTLSSPKSSQGDKSPSVLRPPSLPSAPPPATRSTTKSAW